jgi:hypothetical protein
VASGSFRLADQSALRALEPVIARLPDYFGAPVRVRFRPELRAWQGRLLSKSPAGRPVHAACHVRRREMVLDTELLKRPGELARIFIHEVHHFVWVRLGNAKRLCFERALALEIEQHARGELGWSAQLLKNELSPADAARRTRRWRDYVCESFCDTAAWMYSPQSRHSEWTLAKGRREIRARVLRNLLSDAPVSI